MSHVMERTTVVFPAGLKKRAMARARARKISFSEFVRQAVKHAADEAVRKTSRGKDPFWSDVATYDGPVPPDISINHDKYLYDEPDS
jgi:hypothetical protein